MDIIKGRTATITCTVYSNWTGDAVTSTLANLTGAIVKIMGKAQDSDLDSAALFNITGTVTDALNGLCSFIIPANTTNSVSQRMIFVEVVAKLQDGVTYIGGGIDIVNIKPNLTKTLF